MGKPTKPTFASGMASFLSGMKATLPASVKGIPVTGQMIAPAQAEQSLQSFLNAVAATATAKAAYQHAVATEKSQRASVEPLYSALLSYVKQLFAGNVTALARLGLARGNRDESAFEINLRPFQGRDF